MPGWKKKIQLGRLFPIRIDMFDLDFSSFKGRSVILFVVRLYKGDVQLEKESFAKVQMAEASDQIDGESVAYEHAFVVKRPPLYKLPDFDKIKVTLVNGNGEFIKDWSVFVSESRLEKTEDHDDGRSEFRIVIKEIK